MHASVYSKQVCTVKEILRWQNHIFFVNFASLIDVNVSNESYSYKLNKRSDGGATLFNGLGTTYMTVHVIHSIKSKSLEIKSKYRPFCEKLLNGEFISIKNSNVCISYNLNWVFECWKNVILLKCCCCWEPLSYLPRFKIKTNTTCWVREILGYTQPYVL